MKLTLPSCLLIVVCAVPGCRSGVPWSGSPQSASPQSASPLASDMAATSATSTTADSPAAKKEWQPITFVDQPDLQVGAGAMDAVPVPEFSTTDSGLRYRILRNSNRKKPSGADTVSVHYRGWLNSGKVFDSSYERGEPTTFPLRNVIAGWTEGMQLVGEGGMIELWVPSKLGYGERGSPGSIPAHANLHFIVELVSVD